MKTVYVLICLVGVVQIAEGAIIVGQGSDFEDGTLQNWDPPKANTANVAGGPAGSTRFLEVSPAVGPGRIAAFNSIDYSGSVAGDVTGFSMYMMRPSGQSNLEMRLVLVGPGTTNRWTSTNAQTVVGDGTWNQFTFSILEADLTQVLGAGTYSDLTSNVSRLLIRWDEGIPSSSGTSSGTGTLGLDDILAIPEPSAAILSAIVVFGLGFVRRRPSPKKN